MILPEVLEGTLDLATVEALFADVAATGGLVAVVVKHGRQAEPPRGAGGLPEAKDGLLQGRATAVQLRYRHDGREWWDTLMRVGPSAWRLVRIAHET